MADRPTCENLVLRHIGNRTSDWRLEASDLSHLRRAMGEDLLVAFVRCFVHSDRLTSLAHFGALNGKAEVPEPAVSRNYFTCMWLSIGILKEFATALQSLRSELAKQQLLHLDPTALERIRDAEERWQKGLAAKEVRNTQAFHVDSDVIRRGLARLEQGSAPAILVEGRGTSDYQSRLTIAAQCLVSGSEADSELLRRTVQSAYDDTKVYLAVDDLFVATLKHVGAIVIEEEWTPRPEAPPPE